MSESSADTAAAIRRRLKSRADELGLEFQQALLYYATERFLYRLSKSPWADRLVIKGARDAARVAKYDCAPHT